VILSAGRDLMLVKIYCFYWDQPSRRKDNDINKDKNNRPVADDKILQNHD
jgi:hypothetical protein